MAHFAGGIMTDNPHGAPTNPLNFKHISEVSEVDQERALRLAEKIKKLWETYGILDSEIADPYLTIARRTVDELQQIGFMVSLKHRLLFDRENGTYKLETQVDLHTLKHKPGHC